LGKPESKFLHILIRCPGKTTHEIGNNVLFFARLDGLFGENIQKTFKESVTRLTHQFQNMITDMFGGDLELAPDKIIQITRQCLHILEGEIKPHSTGHPDITDATTCLHRPEHVQMGLVIDLEMGTDGRGHAAGALTRSLSPGALSTPHIGTWTTHIGNIPLESWQVGHSIHFIEYGSAASGGNPAPLMQGQGTK
jgi:hypothetical protein